MYNDSSKYSLTENLSKNSVILRLVPMSEGPPENFIISKITLTETVLTKALLILQDLFCDI